MSKYVNKIIIDEETGKPKIVKHLNKIKINRKTLKKAPGGGNKSGANARIKKQCDKPRDKSIDLDAEKK